MFHLEISTNNFTNIKVDFYKFKKSYFNSKYTLYFIGNFRTSFKIIDEIISKFSVKNFDKKNIEKLFSKINGICTLIIKSEKEIKVCASIYHPHLKIFHKKDKIIITEEEFYIGKKFSSENSFLKLFSAHSYFFHQGLSDNVIDFISPGSYVTFNKDDLYNHQFSWYLDFENFCSRDDHEKVSIDMAENYINVFSDLDKNKKYFFALSGGLDSAIAMSAALKNIDVQPFHITRGMYSDELNVAKGVSKFFKKEISTEYTFGKKFSALNFSDDISEELEFAYDFIKKDSVFYFLNNWVLKRNFSDCHIFTGTGDPLILTIHHMMVYSDRVRKKFGYSLNKDQRYYYSIKFFEELQSKYSKIDEFNFFEHFPNINPYYYPLLSSYVYQLTKMFNFREKFLGGNNSIDDSRSSPILELTTDHKHLLKVIRKRQAILIIKKILKSEFFNENLKNPDARTSQILLKFLMFLGQYGKENHQGCRINDERSVVEFTAMNTSIALGHLSVVIDDQLVNYSKWHLFKAFEHINGVSYEDIYTRPSLTDLKFVFQRMHSKLRRKFRKLPEFDDKYALINNQSLDNFVKKNKIIEKFNDFKASHENKNLLYNYPDNSERMNINKLESNFWKMNNIINIANKIE